MPESRPPRRGPPAVFSLGLVVFLPRGIGLGDTPCCCGSGVTRWSAVRPAKSGDFGDPFPEYHDACTVQVVVEGVGLGGDGLYPTRNTAWHAVSGTGLLYGRIVSLVTMLGQ